MEYLEIEDRYFVVNVKVEKSGEGVIQESNYIFKHPLSLWDIKSLHYPDAYCDVIVTINEYDKHQEIVNTENYVYREMPIYIPESFKVEKTTVENIDGGYYMKCIFNGKEYSKRVSRDIYDRYNSRVYNDLEFAFFFFGELLKIL